MVLDTRSMYMRMSLKAVKRYAHCSRSFRMSSSPTLQFELNSRKHFFYHLELFDYNFSENVVIITTFAKPTNSRNQKSYI
jgi:hypothetical protein